MSKAEMIEKLNQLNEILKVQKTKYFKQHLYEFVKEILDQKDESGHNLLHQKPHKELCDFVQTEKRFKLILMPRGSFKTSVVTIGYSLFSLVKNPNIRILIDSETLGRSKKFLSEIKRHLESNEKLRELYGVHNAKSDDTWSKTEIYSSQRVKNLKEPSIAIAGIDTPAVGLHFDLIIADDLHSEKNITSRDQIDQVIEHYKLLLSVLEPDGELIVIGTRWDDTDLYGYIIDNEADRFDIMKRSAIDDDGNLLMPDRLSQEFLDNMKKTQGSYLYSCQYLNDPVSREDAEFKQEDFRYYEPKDIDNMPLNVFMAVDPAISQRDSGDFTAIVVGGFDGAGNLYILDIFRQRVNPGQLVNQIFLMADQWMPRLLGIETTVFQQVLAYNLRDEMKVRGRYLPMIELRRDTAESKENRIRALVPRYLTHNVYHPKSHPHLSDMEMELVRFPRGKHDDIIDATSDLLQMAFTPKKRKMTQRKLREPIVRSTGW